MNLGDDVLYRGRTCCTYFGAQKFIASVSGNIIMSEFSVFLTTTHSLQSTLCSVFS